MSRLFYQSNFCAECGNRQPPRRWWQSGCFCGHCARQQNRRRLLWPLSLLLCGILLGVALSPVRKNTAPAQFNGLSAVTVPAVSAQDATARLRPVSQTSAPPAAEFFLCGARTRKGTPCRHRVRQAGQRCAQHQGLASILK
ncbi:MAG TPA: hypothetical protein VNQ79_15995 [Blastocatellia bacterium]|nr:hypothetical protein [Blastocatellia bacterium]